MKKSWKLGKASRYKKLGPYTFYVPSKKILSSLSVGNLVKLMFELTKGEAHGVRAERMWVRITKIDDKIFTGLLDNHPKVMKDLELGDEITFSSDNIINTELDEFDPLEKYLKKCIVSKHVEKKKRIGYLYREKPIRKDDSGWRILEGSETDKYINYPGNASLSSLGAVLNIDDSIVNVLDADIGSEFERKRNKFIRVHKK